MGSELGPRGPRDRRDRCTAATAPSAAAPGAAAVLGAGNLAIEDGTLTYRDGKTGDVTRVAIKRFFVRARDRNVPVLTEFRGTIDDVAVSLEGTLGPIASLLEKRWPYPVSLKGSVQDRPAEFSANVNPQGSGYTLDALNLKLGANTLTGDLTVVTGGPRPLVRFKLEAPTLVVAELPLPARDVPAARGTATGEKAKSDVDRSARAPSAAPAAPPSKNAADRAGAPTNKAAAGAPAGPAAPHASGAAPTPHFADVEVSFGPLAAIDAEGSLGVQRLVLPDGQAVENFRVALVLANSRLDVPSVQGEMLGGSLAGRLTIDAARQGDTALSVHLNGNGLSLGAMLAALGKPREVRGGKSELALNLTMRGRTPRQWAKTLSGSAKVVVGPATLVNTKMPDGPLERVLDAINPLRTTDASTELVCAVIRLPFDNGIARVDKSIAMETKTLGVSASGTLDLRNESMDFSFSPRVRAGIPIQIPNLAQLVRLSGPIAAPQVKVDAAGSAAVIASIGAAVSTGGWSAVGQALLAGVESGGEGPCRVALGGTAAKGSAEPAKPATGVPLVDDIGKAIGRLFGK